MLVDDYGRAHLSDTGLYTVVSQSDFTTANIAGSCRWSPPELLDLPEDEDEVPNSAILTPASDVYSFGMAILEVGHSFKMIT